MEKSRIIVIGNGMVGHRFCEKLVEAGGLEQYELVVFGEELYPAYDRVHLSEYFEGKSLQELSLATYDWYVENNVALYTGDPVLEIDRNNKTIHTHKGKELNYDKLVFATGSGAFVPPIEGVEKDGVFVYRNWEDLDAITDYAKKSRKAAVMGGGLLGLEAAKAMYDLGLETDVIEFARHLMPRQLDDDGARVLQDEIEKLGLNIYTDKKTTAVKGQDDMTGLSFEDGTDLDADMLVISAGIRPRDELAKKAGIKVGKKGGIEINDHLETSDPDVYAIGEVALYNGMIYGLVAPGYDMAETLVKRLTGDEEAAFRGADMSTKLKLIGTDVASFGDYFANGEDVHTLTWNDPAKGIYKRINITADGQYLLGGMLVGDAEEYGMLLQAVQNGMVLPPNPEDLILGDRGGESSGGGGFSASDLPDSALVCSCENVSKGDIREVVKEKDLSKPDEIAQHTGAGTGCGGCAPMVKEILDATHREMGKEVKENLCDHFDYTRQELYHLVKIHGLKSYDEVLEHYGQGHGCEKCKPAVASILASIWNEPIMEQETIQDTNDRFLANIQKGGTYSVVPRVPAGEITPDKLIKLGEVAKKYDLYTKITGGQRVDLFGAHVNDLPKIWEELIEAGFESGHAYGKAVRTVKSCVGTQWCRYGVQDSVGFAIELENRYKGLRAPHKLKFAVSGCIRECAEAQSKDIGVIATESGWNLYVCGNGGSNPQHATLLVSDVDKETCIKYIDRLLMFYVRTAAPLTRTAKWFNKLEGGIDYLYQVVVEDSLGIAQELEEEMHRNISNYKDEWKDAVEDPEKRKKFTHFINAPEEKDEHVQFTRERGQKVPVDNAW